jgi:ABC-2 type transport system ATP-binding protein
MQKIISLKDMSYSIPYSSLILDKFSIEIGEGEFIGVLGHNGAGKTTLIDILMGFRKASSGEVKVFDEDPFAIARAHRNEIAFLSQDVGLKGSLTIGEFLNFHSQFYPRYNKGYESELLSLFRLDSMAKVGSLSLGQQKKVQIVAALASRPRLILIDEITAVLDPETRSVFFRELEKYRKKNPCAILLATNIAEDLIHRCSQIIFVKEQKASVHAPEEIASLFNVGKAVA